MKHARKMVLVDINTVKPSSTKIPENDSLANAINSLVASNEFSKSNFGSNAKIIAQLDKELKEILENKSLLPNIKLKHYDQKLQQYLFLLRESEKSNSPDLNFNKATTPPLYSPSPILVETLSNPISRTTSAESITPIKSESSPILMTVRSSPFVHRKPARVNLPRRTPKEERLRKPSQRRKNKRLEDYFSSWASDISG